MNGAHKRPAPSSGSGGPPSKRSGAGASVGGVGDEPLADDMIDDAVEAGAMGDDMGSPGEDEDFMPVSSQPG